MSRAKRTGSERSKPGGSGWRRIKLALVAVIVLAVAGGLFWRFSGSRTMTIAQRADRNVLLITIDTLRADAMSLYGGRASTPRLDALASRGARFTFAHAHAVVTLPSHASLLTGAYPYEHGVRDNNGYRVRKDSPRWRRVSKRSASQPGRSSAAFPLDQRFGLNNGFDVYDDRIGEVGSAVDFALPERRADAVVSSALTWTGAQKDKWFTWVHVFDPHAPYQAPEEFAKRYPDDPYAAEIAWTDRALGAAARCALGQPRPTLVIVTSRSRREPRRSRRADARHLRVRVDAARAARHRGVSAPLCLRIVLASRSNRRRAMSTSCRRFSTRSACRRIRSSPARRSWT